RPCASITSQPKSFAAPTTVENDVRTRIVAISSTIVISRLHKISSVNASKCPMPQTPVLLLLPVPCPRAPDRAVSLSARLPPPRRQDLSRGALGWPLRRGRRSAGRAPHRRSLPQLPARPARRA